jgi:hypothetical protein
MVVCRLLASDASSLTNVWSAPEVSALEALRGQIAELQAVLPTLEKLQTQQQATLRAVQTIHQQAVSALDRQTALLSTQLTAVSESLARQQQEEFTFLRESHRSLLTLVAAVAGVLCLGLAVLALLSARAMSRLATAASALPAAQLWRLSGQATGEGTATAAAELSLEESLTARLQDALDRLEIRLLELETSAVRAHGSGRPAHAIRPPGSSPSPAVEGKPRGATEGPPRMSMTLREGAAIGFLPGAVGRSGGDRPSSVLLRPLKRLLGLW